jgi:hypothetical protein
MIVVADDNAFVEHTGNGNLVADRIPCIRRYRTRRVAGKPMLFGRS